MANREAQEQQLIKLWQIVLVQYSYKCIFSIVLASFLCADGGTMGFKSHVPRTVEYDK